VKSTLLVIAVAAGVLSGITVASAQAPPTAIASHSDDSGAHDYQLGPGDLVSIRVSGVTEFDQLTRVSNSGRVRVPYVGVLFVAGKTAVDVEREVGRLIQQHELVNEPAVRVEVQEHRARPAYVLGEVNAPGQFVITGEMYLLDLLSKAGGLLPAADQTGFLYRRNWPRPSTDARVIAVADSAGVTQGAGPAAGDPPPAETPPRVPPGERSEPEEVIRIDFDALRNGTDLELNVRLQGGDILYVPRRRPQNIFIIGDVKVPGVYTLPRRGAVTAAQAVIYAGGPLPTAKTGHGFLMRHDDAGVRTAVPVDFDAILKGKDNDFPVRPNDIIFIPSSNVKTVGVGLLS
jgi:protein involved in polysaccharide export with SLBB domain